MKAPSLKITWFSGLALALLLTGCKKPDAQFSLDDSEYAAGEQLGINNLSVNAKSQNWELIGPNGEALIRSDEKHPGFVLPIMMQDGPCSLTLVAKNKEKRQEATTKTFLVKTKRGHLKVTGSGFNQNFVVYVDEQLVGTSHYYTSSSEIVYVPIPEGIRFVKIINTDNGSVQTETVDILEGDDTSILFYP
jgi:hypothetical protein